MRPEGHLGVRGRPLAPRPAEAGEHQPHLGVEQVLFDKQVGRLNAGELDLWDSAAEVERNLDILQEAAGFLRMQLGKAMKLRSVPQLHFSYDASIRRGVELSALIERAVAEDRLHDKGGE